MKTDIVYTVAGARHFIEPMLALHYDELCTDKSMQLAPDWGKYEAMYGADALVITVVFDGNVCVGYEVCFLQPHVHYRGTVVAWSDVLFVHKAYRNTTAGGRLMLATAKECKARGAHKLLRHAKPNTALDTMLAARGPAFEHVYAQTL